MRHWSIIRLWRNNYLRRSLLVVHVHRKLTKFLCCTYPVHFLKCCVPKSDSKHLHVLYEQLQCRWWPNGTYNSCALCEGYSIRDPEGVEWKISPTPPSIFFLHMPSIFFKTPSPTYSIFVADHTHIIIFLRSEVENKNMQGGSAKKFKFVRLGGRIGKKILICGGVVDKFSHSAPPFRISDGIFVLLCFIQLQSGLKDGAAAYCTVLLLLNKLHGVNIWYQKNGGRMEMDYRGKIVLLRRALLCHRK